MTRPSKYGNRKTVVDNVTFDSKAEAARYLELKLLQRAGHIGDLELQPVFSLYGKRGGLICKYKADFKYTKLMHGYATETVVEDVKSKPTMTPVYRLKAKLFEDSFGFKITEVMT